MDFKQVFEIRPMIKWDKGKALEFLLESLGKIFLKPFLIYIYFSSFILINFTFKAHKKVLEFFYTFVFV